MSAALWFCYKNVSTNLSIQEFTLAFDETEMCSQLFMKTFH